MNRFDALEGHDELRLTAVRGAVLDGGLDAELQLIVETLASQLKMPIALVSLVLKRTQYFRAYVGLPRDLAAVRATDRDASFCQFVVRDAASFEVCDAVSDERVPQELVNRYGIRSYLGFPVRLGGHVVGSLCAIDLAPRQFLDSERSFVRDLSQRVSRRLAQLAEYAPTLPASQIGQGAAPAFAELRNLLFSLRMGFGAARGAVTDVAPLVRATELSQKYPQEAQRSLGCLQQAEGALDDLNDLLFSFEGAVDRAQRSLSSLERLLVQVPAPITVRELVEVAGDLSLHHTRNLGGVFWGPFPEGAQIRAPRALAISALASALSLLCTSQLENSNVSLRVEGCESALQGEISLTPRDIQLRLLSRCSLAQRECVLRSWNRIFGDSPSVSAYLDGEEFVLCLAAHTGS
jgi:GAF domain-containing protein